MWLVYEFIILIFKLFKMAEQLGLLSLLFHLKKLIFENRYYWIGAYGCNSLNTCFFNVKMWVYLGDDDNSDSAFHAEHSSH